MVIYCIDSKRIFGKSHVLYQFKTTIKLHQKLARTYIVNINNIMYTGLDKHTFSAYKCRYFLAHHFNVCFGCSKEPPH